MGPQARLAALSLANVLIPVSVLVFALGFFPYKPVLPGLAQYQVLEYGDPPDAPFDRVIFMVVDALRSDYVYSANSGFKYTQRLIRDGDAVPFTAHAASPTITMPRVKAMTTGSIPSFVDMILNFAESDTTSTLAYQDTWLAQMRAKKQGVLVMYGDDTWLRLFPGFFGRADGTSSFFVSDFTEVDNNVTRHVPDELRANDWNTMIMHYLGLDHIGHKAGPNSPHMVPKQEEMDAIVEQIFEAMKAEKHLQSALLVLCGDHGMNDGGNHGGSAPGETSPALVFMSPKLRALPEEYKSPTTASEDFDFYTKVEQSDIAPTLAGLLGFPIPLNNLGVFIPEFLPLWPNGHDGVQLLLRNAYQILNIVKATFPNPAFDSPFVELDCDRPFSSGHELACKWRKVTNVFMAMDGVTPRPDEIKPLLLDFCRSAQSVMSSTASNYNITQLGAGIVAAALSILFTLSAMYPFELLSFLDGTHLIVLIGLYGTMMFASSYVEEEQHFWYWATSGWLAFLAFRRLQTQKETCSLLSKLGPTLLLLLHRISRRWNQTGQKHAGAPDIVHDWLVPHPSLLWYLVTITYMTVLYRLAQRFARELPSEAILLPISAATALSFIAMLFKLSFTVRDAPELFRGLHPDAINALGILPLVALARMVFVGLGLGLAWIVFQGRNSKEEERRYIAQGFHDLLTLFLMTQTRATNIPLFLIFMIEQQLLAQSAPSSTQTTQTTMSTILLSHVSFFALGNSNAISSIDLSNAYNGVSGYSIVGVGILVFVSNWAGPIWWTSAGILRLLGPSDADANAKPAAVTSDEKRREWIEAERARLSASAAPRPRSPKTPGIARKSGQFPSPLFTHLAVSTLFTTSALLSVMVACTVLRTHLFIWTVFSPKYLYAMAWSLAHHLFISIGLSSVIWRLGGSGAH